MWHVQITSSARKQIKRLPKLADEALGALLKEIEVYGPYRNNWPNYGQLKKNNYHCHFKKGRPTYVACWTVEDKKIKIVEVYYAGTHEKAPY